MALATPDLLQILPMENAIDLAKAAIQAAAKDIPRIQRAVDTAAARLAAGGRFWIAGQPGMVSELTGRAGGLMMAQPLPETAAAAGDIVLYFGDDTLAPPDSARLNRATVIACGSRLPESTEYRIAAPESPLPSLYNNAICGWTFTGELIASLIRLGKMPVIYESIGAYSGFARIQKYENGAVTFHSDMPVPQPVSPGELGHRYAKALVGMLERIQQDEADRLDCAGTWCRQARKDGKRLYMYSMGHLFPALVADTAIGEVFKSNVWNAGFHGDKPADTFDADDVVVHVGYQHPPSILLARLRDAGARGVYVAVRPDRDYPTDDRVLWIDPMWNWPDACIEIEGYDVPLLAASGIVNGAIALEIHRRTTS